MPWRSTAFAAIGLVWIGLFLLDRNARLPVRVLAQARFCARLYPEARTAADTARVDRTHSPTTRGGIVNRTCRDVQLGARGLPEPR